MYENATTLQFEPGTFDEGLHILRTCISPLLRGQPGLLGLALIPNRHEFRITVLSMWNSPAFARSIEALPEYRQEVRKLDPLLVGEPLYPTKQPILQRIKENAMSLN